MKTQAIRPENWALIERLLMPQNALVVETCLRYGLRVGDALQLRTEQVKKGSFTIYEEKTGKRRRLRIGQKFREKLLKSAGIIWVFQGRLSVYHHRTRQAVWKDLKRAARALRAAENIGTHSARKTWACEYYRRNGYNLNKLRDALNHESAATTLIYICDLLEKGLDNLDEL